MFKNQRVAKSMLQFRVEVFNLFNRDNFNPPADPRVFNTDGTLVPGSGRITSLATPARQVQFGIKYLF
jgi:hypothetical protein